MPTDLHLAAILGGLSLRERRRVELPALTARWTAFVRDVGRGRASVEDYASSLSVRDLLADIVASVGPAGGGTIDAAIRPADDVFRAVTRVVDHPRRVVRGDRWWWTRIPAGLGNFTETTR